MGLFRKKAAPKTVRRYVTVEESAAPAKEVAPKRRDGRTDKRSSGQRRSSQRTRSGQQQRTERAKQDRATAKRPRPHLEIVPPPDTARKQMLVRSMPHQTQIVVLEGPVLVEHYVARSDKKSLVGNVYVGKVRNVLPGMEAAFVDFGEGKNGVLYAGDVNYDETDLEGKRRRIEMVLKAGDSVLVQVVKDAMGHKGARLTNQISLAGRYLVLSPDPEVRGISRRLPEEERKRLRDIIAEVRPKGMGVIVRTAAEGASKEDVEADITRLRSIWESIDAKRATPGPALIYEEPPLVLRVIREHFTRDFRRLLIDDQETYERVLEYLEGTEADLKNKVKLYEDELPLFERFHVEDQLRKALDRKVWLPSGGHIVIDRTEALTVIDVNTGRFVGHSNLEETVLQNNLEAAEEIARQLRLRDIGGIIVIDFIDMEVIKNQEAVLLKFREQLAKDKMRTQVFEVSNLGLVEMTRKNVSAGLLESFSELCPHCNGRGVLLHEDAATAGTPVPGLAEEVAD
jgi:ribonuclease E